MTKIFLQLAIPLAFFLPSKAQANDHISHKQNYIDSIQSAKQIADLILKISDRYKGFQINEALKFDDIDTGQSLKKIADSVQIQPWTKADFDNNGLTDVLVVGRNYYHCVICIFDKGGKYEINQITRRHYQNCTFPVVEKKNKIRYYYKEQLGRSNWNKPLKFQKVNLIYKFGDFVEENPHPANHKIEKIEYSTSGCYGTCPVFSLEINSDRGSKWFAYTYNMIDKKELTGNFQTIIDQDKFEELINLLNYINFEVLNDKYAVNWTDDQSSTLKITYDKGKVKSIKDYGLIGTFGLDRVYQLLFDLRENQKWTKIDFPVPF